MLRCSFCRDLQTQKQDASDRIRKKREVLEDLTLQYVALKHLVVSTRFCRLCSACGASYS